MNELKEWEKENIQRLEEQEEKAYARRQLADEAILGLLSEIYTQKTEPADSVIFLKLRMAFQEYESAESRCCVTTDRLAEFHQRNAI